MVIAKEWTWCRTTWCWSLYYMSQTVVLNCIIIIIIIIGNTPTGGAMQNYNYFKYQYNTIDT